MDEQCLAMSSQDYVAEVIIAVITAAVSVFLTDPRHVGNRDKKGRDDPPQQRFHVALQCGTDSQLDNDNTRTMNLSRSRETVGAETRPDSLNLSICLGTFERTIYNGFASEIVRIHGGLWDVSGLHESRVRRSWETSHLLIKTISGG
ncbi:hypothetical protein ACLOJK_034065 [Asimina triloba]